MDAGDNAARNPRLSNGSLAVLECNQLEKHGLSGPFIGDGLFQILRCADLVAGSFPLLLQGRNARLQV